MTGNELLQSRLLSRDELGNFRELPSKSNGVDFFSNDYLGLSRNRSLLNIVAKTYNDISDKWLGSTGSRLLSGNSAFYENLEGDLADYFLGDAALIFNSGYAANTSLLQCVALKGDTILMDEFSHASIKEGARLSFAKKLSFKHNRVDSIIQKLNHCRGNVFVVVESIYSMDGDMCPLADIVDVCNQYNCHLILDEAHSTGLYDENGRGLAVHLGLEENIFARIYTFGKAIGAHGAIIVGDKILKDYLVNFAMSFIYTTSLPLHSLVNIREAILYQKRKIEERKQLSAVINHFNLLAHDNKNMTSNDSPVQAIKISGNEEVSRVARILDNRGYLVKAIKSPTVKKGEERIRICLHSYNTLEEVTSLVDEINNVL